MKLLTALADAAFARTICAAASIDFDAARAAKNANVIKDALAAAKQSDDAEAILTEASKENADLAAKLQKAEAESKIAADNFKSLSACVEASGVKLADVTTDRGIDADKFAAAHKLAVAKTARDMVAAAGHPGILETPKQDAGTEAENKRKAATAGLSGESRIRADFDAQLRNLNLPKNQRN